MSATLDQRHEHRTASTSRNDVVEAMRRWAEQWGQDGWMTHATTHDKVEQNRLSAHATWCGPTKLIGSGEQIQELTEVFLSPELFTDQGFDPEAKDQFQSLMHDLSASVLANRSPASKRKWRAPGTGQLVDWLTERGFQTAIGDDGDLRLTIKARGCDGQVRVCCDEGHLRFTMRLGAWSNLDEDCEEAMAHLARQANDCGRLARIAWIADGNARRCEAQVDLTGLPTDGPAELIWPGMLCMSMHALELALRRLGMELEPLADPANRDIAIQLIKQKQH